MSSDIFSVADQRLQKLVRQIDAKWAAEIVQSLVKVNDVHQMAQLLEDEQRLREQVIKGAMRDKQSNQKLRTCLKAGYPVKK